MKVLKKLSLVLCLCFAFTGVATGCNEIGNLFGKNSSASENNSTEENSSTGAPESSAPSQEELDAAVAADVDEFQALVVDAFDGAKSAKLDFSFAVSSQIVSGPILADGSTGTSTVVTTVSKIGGTIWISEAENGIDLKLNVEYGNNDDLDATELYYIDDYLYVYDAESQNYSKSPFTATEYLNYAIHRATEGLYTLETLAPQVLDLLTIAEIPEFKASDIWNVVKDYGVTVNVAKTDDAFSVSADSEKAINDYLATFDKLTMDSTLEAALNSQLGYINPLLNTKFIINTLATQGAMTVAQVVEYLETGVLARTGVGFQANLDRILTNEIVDFILSANLEADVYEKVNAFDVEAFLTEYGAVTLDDLAVLITGEENVNWMMLMSIAQGYLTKTKLSDLEDEDGTIADVLGELQELGVSKAQSDWEATIEGEAVTSITYSEAYVINTAEVASENGFSFTFTVSEISENKTVIELPQDAAVVELNQECEHCGEAKETVFYAEELFGFYCPECVTEYYTCGACGEVKPDVSRSEGETGYYCVDCRVGKTVGNEPIEG